MVLSFKDLARCRQIIREIADNNGQTETEVRGQMQALLDLSWDQGDPEARAKLDALFPAGKPSLEEFILILSGEVREGMIE